MHDFPILYEDNDLLVIDKPYGVVVNRARTVKDLTIQDWMEKKLGIAGWELQINKKKEIVPSLLQREGQGELEKKPSPDDFYSRTGVVHRLDKETSGCLILAKDPVAFVKLQTAFKDHQVKKTYIALIHDKLVPEKGEVNAPIGRLPWNREQFWYRSRWQGSTDKI